jgi:SUZ domain
VNNFFLFYACILIKFQVYISASKLKHSMSLIPAPKAPPLEERQTAYLAARNRIFGLSSTEEGDSTSPKLRKDPTVARRMIAHALGCKMEVTSDPDRCGNESKNGRTNDGTQNYRERRGNNPRSLNAENLKKEQLGQQRGCLQMHWAELLAEKNE